MAQLAKTRNTLGENARLASVGLLNAALADLMDLSNAVKMAHWNVKGPQFAALHLLFEGFYTQLAAAVDRVGTVASETGGKAVKVSVKDD